MPIDDKDFYHMQAHMRYQDEKFEKLRIDFKEDTAEIKKDVETIQATLNILLEHMHQQRGSMRTAVMFSGLIGAVVAGITEYIVYYVLQK